MVFIIYTKEGCGNCTKAKKLLEKEETIVINCDDMLRTNRELFINDMKQKTGWERIVFPMIFIDSDFLGGYDDLVSHIIFDIDDCMDYL
jgi:glutaredoxin